MITKVESSYNLNGTTYTIWVNGMNRVAKVNKLQFGIRRLYNVTNI